MKSIRAIYFYLLIVISSLLIIAKININLLPLDETSNFRISTYSISRPPIDTELKITSLMENALAQIEGIKSISSISGSNYSSITISFEDKNSQAKRLEIVNIIRNLKEKLPSDTSYPTINNNSGFASKQPVLIYELYSNISAYSLKEIVQKELVEDILNVNGIENVNVSGFREKIIRIKFRNHLFFKHNITKTEIVNALNNSSQAISLGPFPVSSDSLNYFVIDNPLLSIKELEDIIIKGNIVLKDVAYVSIEGEKESSITRVNGQNRISLAIYPTKDNDRIKLSETIKKMLSNNNNPNFTLKLIHEDAKYLKSEIQDSLLKIAIVVICLLSVISIYYRNGKLILILFSGLIGTISMSLIVLFLFKYTINPYSLIASIIGLELSIGQTVLIIDSLLKNRRIKAFNAILTTSLITLVLLWSVTLLTDYENSIVLSFAIILSILAFSSLLTNLFLIPSLYDLLKPQAQPVYKFNRLFGIYVFTLNQVVRFKWVIIGLAILSFGIPTFLLPENSKIPFYNKTIGSTEYRENIKPHVEKYLGGTWRLFYENSFKKSEKIDFREAKLIVTASLEYGHTISHTNELMMKIESYLANFKSINYITTISSPEDAQIEITFENNLDKTSFPNYLKDQLTSFSLKYGGVKWDIVGIGNGFTNYDGGVAPSYRILVKGFDYNTLEVQTRLIKNELEKNDRIHDVNTNAKIYRDTKQLSNYNLILNRKFTQDNYQYLSSIMEELRNETVGNNPETTILINGKRFPVWIENENSENFTISDLQSLPVVISNSKNRLGFVSQIEKEISTNNIIREEREYIKSISFDYYGSNIFGDKFLKSFIKAFNVNLPIGFKISDPRYSLVNTQNEEKYILIFTLFFMSFLISSIFLESYRKSLIVILLTPLPLIGVFLSFYLFSIPFDQGGLFSFLFVATLSISSIIYIMNELFNVNNNIDIIEMLFMRGRTVLINSMTLILSFIPLILFIQSNNTFWKSFGLGTVGGSIFVLFISLFVLPIFVIKKSKNKVDRTII